LKGRESGDNEEKIGLRVGAVLLTTKLKKDRKVYKKVSPTAGH